MNDDLISRKALKKTIEEVQYTQEFCIEHHIDYSVSMQMLGMVIDNAQPVEITDYDTGYQDGLEDGLNDIRPQGEWIIKSNGTTNYYACNKCGSAGDFQDNFCRVCGNMMKVGADMEGDIE